MTTNAPESTTRGCQDCDLGPLDSSSCEDAGIAAQAAYNATSRPPLDQARQTYAQLRTQYREQRSAVALEVQDLRHQVRTLLERIRCLIKQARVVECLDEAYENVCEQLRQCQGPAGCCADDECTFDTECPDEVSELLRRIADYQAHVDRAQECFTTLSGEPAALAKRVADARAEVAKVAEALNADPAATDLKRLYASALVAQRHVHEVWGAFAQSSDFTDCLCRVLRCWNDARNAVSALTKCKAVEECLQEARDKHCTDLATRTVDEILLAYERLCGCEPCADDPDDGHESCDDDCACHDGGHHHDDHDDDHGHGHGHDHGHGKDHGHGHDEPDEECRCGRRHHHHPHHEGR